MINEIIQKLKEHGNRSDEHDKQLETIAGAVLENTKKFNKIEANMATKDDILDISNKIDQLVGFVKKKDEELAFTSERIK